MVIAHVVNDVGAWGAGFTAALSQRWPEPEAAYRRGYREKVAPASATPFTLGAATFVPVPSDTPARWWVANVLAQRGLPTAGRQPLDLDALPSGLAAVAAFAASQQASVVCPRLGAGLARGRWPAIVALLASQVVAAGVDVCVYTLPSR